MTKDRKTKVDKILHRKLNSTIKCGMNLDALKWQVVPIYDTNFKAKYMGAVMTRAISAYYH
jgi:hypothetical protein